jgi:hypothetical protein
LASSLGYVLVQVDLLCILGLCLVEGRIRVGRPTLRKPYSYEVVMRLVTLVLLIDTWMDAGSILSLWVLSALETLSDITTNLVRTLLNPLNLGRKEGLPVGRCSPSGWNLYFGLAIPCLFNAFLFYYDTTVAALSVINNETVGTDMERRLLLLLCGAAVWYRGFQELPCHRRQSPTLHQQERLLVSSSNCSAEPRARAYWVWEQPQRNGLSSR